MSYKALYRTYRPNNFDEIKGQDHIVVTLKNIIKTDKVSHAFLFAGPRGTGKTSAAKVFAAVLNCKDIQEDLKPCNKCEFCIENKKGSSLDVIEMDAASNNGVAEIRDIREKIKYTPSNAKYKIYIIDEVHMLTKGAFNALLKTLEEPPAHAIFILATTEPHKIPVTILSRTQRFNFRRVENKVLQEHLKTVLEKENMTYDSKALKLIAQLSNGGMRDALSIADQAASYTGGEITFDGISQVFGIISDDYQIELLQHAASNNVEQVLLLANKFIEGGADISRLTMSLVEIIKDFIIYKKTSQIKLLEILSEEQVQNIEIPIGRAYEMMDILVQLLSETSRSDYPRQTFELGMIKMSKSINPIPEKVEAKPVKTLSKIKEEAQPIAVEAPVKNNDKIPEDIFSTKELNEINEIEESVDNLIDTNEIDNATNVISTDIEEENEAQEVENAIVTTQEFEKPETDDLMSLFSTEKDSEQDNAIETKKYSISEIINLLVQASPEKHAHIKKTWPSILSFTTVPKYNEFSTLLDATKLISSGERFLLVSSDDANVCNVINDSKFKPEFIEMINEIFGMNLNVFAITKKEFIEIKDRYMQLSNSNGLPSPKEIAIPQKGEKEKTQQQKDGEDLFGDLFSN